MMAQSSVEFLSSYAFLFIIMTVAILLIAFIISSARSYVPPQCEAFGSINCNFISLYANYTYNYSIATMAITNAESTPINITSLITSFSGVNYTGTCSPNFIYPGEQTTCIANITSAPSVGYTLNGQYFIKGFECNSGVSALQENNCTTPINDSGTYVTTATTQPVVVFSAIATISPASEQLVSYNGVSPPFIPSGYTPIQNGEWSSSPSGNYVSYDFATPGDVPGTDQGNLHRQDFPALVSLLNNNAVSGTAPYNSLLSMSYTAIYVPLSGSISAKITTQDAMAVYYKAASATTWNSMFGGTEWGMRSSPVTATSPSNAVQPGLYDVAVVWSDTNGLGVQAINLTS